METPKYRFPLNVLEWITGGILALVLLVVLMVRGILAFGSMGRYVRNKSM